MKITHPKINHLVNPLGYDLGIPTATWAVEEAKGKQQTAARVLVSETPDFSAALYLPTRHRSCPASSYQ